MREPTTPEAILYQQAYTAIHGWYVYVNWDAHGWYWCIKKDGATVAVSEDAFVLHVDAVIAGAQRLKELADA